MSPQRGGVAREDSRNQEFKELRRRIEELKNRRNGDVELDSEVEEEVEVEQNIKEVDPTMHLISFLSKRSRKSGNFMLRW